jgi:hypothetical protein
LACGTGSGKIPCLFLFFFFFFLYEGGVKDVPKGMYNEANLPSGSSSVALRQLCLVECVFSRQQVTSAIHSSRNPVQSTYLSGFLSQVGERLKSQTRLFVSCFHLFRGDNPRSHYHISSNRFRSKLCRFPLSNILAAKGKKQEIITEFSFRIPDSSSIGFLK